MRKEVIFEFHFCKSLNLKYFAGLIFVNEFGSSKKFDGIYSCENRPNLQKQILQEFIRK